MPLKVFTKTDEFSSVNKNTFKTNKINNFFNSLRLIKALNSI